MSPRVIQPAAETSPGSPRVLIVDDHPLVRDGLMRVLSQQKDLACCGQAGTAPETFTAVRVRAHRPDLVILDLRLKNGDGLELIESLTALTC